VEVFDPASTRGELGLDLGFLLYSLSVSMETPVDHPYHVSMDTSPRNGLVSKNPSPRKRVLPTRSLVMSLHVTIVYLLRNIFKYLRICEFCDKFVHIYFESANSPC
jgi:hypothetical protein